MKLKLSEIKDKGLLEKERVVLKVLSKTNSYYYMIVQNRYTNDELTTISNKPQNLFWLPDNEVNPNDLIIFYSKEGTDSTKENKDGTKSYFYYGGLKSPIFKSKKDCVVIVEILGWETY